MCAFVQGGLKRTGHFKINNVLLSSKDSLLWAFSYDCYQSMWNKFHNVTGNFLWQRSPSITAAPEAAFL
jgi:hypothetical protein